MSSKPMDALAVQLRSDESHETTEWQRTL